ncbi:hypothetical protein NliqN6_0452 [Naganishia liquefaciens]|uniref:Centrosomin N-terminal motif 1 domain-containing protein n=1 Tax=Naganishia liquefaciens TaxID=104408 RepID=A0A8H3TMY7_9TREE|nr:hypothetical protein NliqN6_0452 [Naganishia liquefaciens]
MSGHFVLSTPHHGNQTVLHGKTLPDISLGSMAGSFDAEQQEELDLQRQNGGGGRESQMWNGGWRANLDGPAAMTPQARRSATPTGTPPTAYRTAVTSYDESASISAQAFSKRRPLPSSATDSSISVDQAKLPAGMYFAFGDASKDSADDDDDDLLSQSQMLPTTSPGWEGATASRRGGDGNGRSSRASMAGSMTASRSGRQSVASSDIRQSQNVNHVQQMTLRDQQQDHEKLRTENFSLRLENASLKELVHKKIDRDKAELFTENANLKATIESLMQSTKQNKKVILQLQRALEKAAKEQASMEDNLQALTGENGELERLRADIRDEEDARISAENRLREMQDELDEARHSRSREEATEQYEELMADLRERLQEAEQDAQTHQVRADKAEEQMEDLREAMAKLTDERDKLQDEVDTLQANAGPNEEQKELENRLHEEIDSLSSDKASLQREMEALRVTLTAREDENQDIERLRRDIRELEAIIQEKNDSLERAAGMEEELEELRAIADEKEAALEEIEAQNKADLADLDEQWRASLAQAEEKIQILEEDISEMEERFKATTEQLTDKIMEAETLNQELQQMDSQLAILEKDKERLIEELRSADREVQEADLTREAVHHLEDEARELRQAEEHALRERDNHRRTVDELSRQLASIEGERRAEKEQNRQLIAERDDLAIEIRRREQAFESEVEHLRGDAEQEVERWKRMISEKEQSNLRLSQELEAARENLAHKDEDVRDLQDALNKLENARRRLGDERSIDQYSSQLEIDRVKRDLARNEDQLHRALEDIQNLEATLSDKQAELADLIAEKRDTESRLTAERQDRLAISDKLSEAIKVARQAENNASGYRERIEELERRLSDDRKSLTASVRQSDKPAKEVQDLLRTAYVKISQVLNLDSDVPNTPTALREKLSLRLKQLVNMAGDYEKKIRGIEIKLEYGIANLNRELDSKKRLLDNVENSVAKMTAAKQEWRAKLLAKEEELAQAKARQREIASELASFKASNTVESSSELRSLQVKASSGDKRVNALSNQLAELQSIIASQESKHAEATNKWEDRVREYEKRLKAAAEKVKAEKQGGKERVNHLEQTVRDLNEQIKLLRAKEGRLNAIVRAASFTRDDPDAL